MLIKTKKGLQTHQGFLRKLIRDERLQPSRRLLAEMVLLAIEGHIPLALVQDIYGNAPQRMQWNERKEGVPESEAANAADKAAEKLLRDLYGGLDESSPASDEAGS
jgi:hypothetical protein